MGFQVGDPQERIDLGFATSSWAHSESAVFGFFFCLAPQIEARGLYCWHFAPGPWRSYKSIWPTSGAWARACPYHISKMALAEWGKMMGKMVWTKDCFFFGCFWGLPDYPIFGPNLEEFHCCVMVFDHDPLRFPNVSYGGNHREPSVAPLMAEVQSILRCVNLGYKIGQGSWAL